MRGGGSERGNTIPYTYATPLLVALPSITGVPLVIVAVCAGTGIKYELYATYSEGEFFL